MRAKMAALLVVASLLPLVAAMILDIRGARERLLANTGALLSARGDHLSDQLDAFNRSYQRSVEQFDQLAERALLAALVSFEEAASVFLDPAALTFSDPDHSDDEERAITIGRSARQRVLFVAHTEREDRLRIITARRATHREQEQYEEGIDEATP